MKKAIRFFLFFTWTVVVGVSLFEIACQIFKPAPIFHRISILAEEGDYTLSENRDLIYVPKPNTKMFNSMGVRGQEFPLNRVVGKRRIVCLGDSVLEGLGVAAEQRFTEKLRAKCSDAVELINLGVRGYNLVQEIEFLKERGLEFKPDLVFFFLTYNDLEMESGEIIAFSVELNRLKSSTFYHHYYAAQSNIEGLLLRLHSYRYLKYFLSYRDRDQLSAKVPADAPAPYQILAKYHLTPEQTEQRFGELYELSRKHRFELIIVMLPGSSEAESRLIELKKFVVKSPVITYDLNEYIAAKIGEKARDKLLYDTCHLTPAGHSLVAELLLQQFYAAFN